jgi:hypothetical protein
MQTMCKQYASYMRAICKQYVSNMQTICKYTYLELLKLNTATRQHSLGRLLRRSVRFLIPSLLSLRLPRWATSSVFRALFERTDHAVRGAPQAL